VVEVEPTRDTKLTEPVPAVTNQSPSVAAEAAEARPIVYVPVRALTLTRVVYHSFCPATNPKEVAVLKIVVVVVVPPGVNKAKPPRPEAKANVELEPVSVKSDALEEDVKSTAKELTPKPVSLVLLKGSGSG
jgi:hypothetical protein